MIYQDLLKTLGDETTERALSSVPGLKYLVIEAPELMNLWSCAGVVVLDLEDGMYVAPYSNVLVDYGYEQIDLSKAKPLDDDSLVLLLNTLNEKVREFSSWMVELCAWRTLRDVAPAKAAEGGLNDV